MVHLKKILSVFVVVAIICSCFTLVAHAEYNESLNFNRTIEDMFIVDVKGECKELSGSFNKYFFQQDSKYPYKYDVYSQLDKAQKIIYDAVVNSPGMLNITINFDNGVFLYSNFTNDYLSMVMDAISLDRPDIFYYAGYGTKGGQLYSGNKYIKSINYCVMPYDSSLYTESNLPNYYNALMAKLPEIPVDKSNRYNFVKSLHDYLCDNIYYPDLNSSDYFMSAHDAYGGLIEGRAVCQGYSDSFEIVCDYYNIPCICINGSSDGVGHMWNAVQMDDGVWYLLDSTWDDQESLTFYDFFLVGTQSKNTYFGGKTFSAEHTNDSDFPLPNLNYSSVAYDRNQNHKTGFGATYNSAFDNNGKYLYLSPFDVGKSNVYYDGIYVNVGNYYNGKTFTAPSGASSQNETWTMILLGDVDYDGECTIYDYEYARDMAINFDGTITYEDERAADVNLDGTIDALDLFVIARAGNGVNTNIDLS